MSLDPFAGVPAFVAVAEHRSFTKAAAALGVTPAAVSQSVGRLEEDLGTKLLDRTTRTVELTGEGRLYLDYCRSALTDIRTGRQLVEEARQATEGVLVLALPFVLGPVVCARLPRFLQRYPGLQLQLEFSDRISRLVDEPIDVALRIGELGDSTAIAEKLLDVDWIVVASPGYLARRGTPKTPSDLVEHDCIVYRSPRGYEVDWELLTRPGGTETKTVQRPARLITNHGSSLLDAAEAGAGISMVFSFMAQPRLHAGRLASVLDSYLPPGPPVHALVKPGAQKTAKVRALLDFLEDEFRKSPLLPDSPR